MFYPIDFESRIGFDRVRTDISRYCQSTAAIGMVDQMAFSDSYEGLRYAIEITDQMKSCLMMESDFPSSGFVDTRFLVRAKVVGNFLQTQELVVLGKALEVLGELKHFFCDREGDNYRLLRELSDPIDSHVDILRMVRRIIDEFGRVKDNASPELSIIRSDLSRKSGQIGHRLQQILRQAQADGFADSEASVSIRDGRAVIPVGAGFKRKVNGFVHSESATGRTAYIEPLEVVELNNEVRELEMAEKREIVKILTVFTDTIRPVADELIEAGEYVATIDFIAAKAKYAMNIGGVRPILENAPRIMLRKARHPLLEKTLKAEGKKIIPLDLQLTKQKHILLISGPNAGGKSVCLKTVGLLQYMLQCGLLVPVLENSEMGLFDSLLLDIGDQQSLDNDLSTYSSHLTNMKNFLRYATGRSLVLIDEFGGGTEPNIGGAIAEAILEQLRVRGTFGVITTHYANLKYYGSAAEGIENGAMTFDVSRITPLFSLEQGRAGSSFALEIARKIGLPENILDSAKEKVGVDQVNIEKQLREAARDKRYWETKRDKIKMVERGVEKTAQEYEEELSKIKEERSRLIKQAKEEAARIVSQANKQIENTIREIRESQADKERTRAVRESFNNFREGLSVDGEEGFEDVVARKMRKLQEQQQRRCERAEQRANEKPVATKNVVPHKPKEITVGMLVRMEGQTSVGEVISINGDKAVVAFGSVSTQVDKRRLVAATSSEIRKSASMVNVKPVVSGAGFSTLQRRLDFKDTIDLRGMRGADALDQVKLFIDDAMMLGVGQVRILHGKGTGALKQQIREYLLIEPGVSSVVDEHEDMGGAGISVVRLGN